MMHIILITVICPLQLHISARDQGSPSLVSDTAILFVNVVDVNDETPFFPSVSCRRVPPPAETVPPLPPGD